MSIASEISRLQTAKANLKTAIEGKGVAVPSETTLNGYAELVDSISGGSLPDRSITKIGETVIGSGDSSNKLTVDLPANWETTYDFVIGYIEASCNTQDWLYSAFSAVTTTGSYGILPANTVTRTTIIAYATGGNAFYRGMGALLEQIVPSASDYFIVNLYSQNKTFLPDSKLTVYGIVLSS